MKNIHIPEPCHENWADFTPTQKGAFCGSCQIDVVDFSNKTPEQVKQILKENTGRHMCGRFKKSQLEELNNSFFAWENQSVKSFQSKFLYACLIAFGMTLFTSCNISDKQFLSQIGISQTTENTSELNVFSNEMTFDKDTNKVKKPDYNHIKGKVAYIPEEIEEIETPQLNESNCTNPDTNDVKVEPFIMGDIAYDPNEFNSTENTIEDSLLNQPIVQDTLFDDQMVDGEIMWTPEFDEFIEDSLGTHSIGTTSLNTPPFQETANIEIPDEPAFETSLYPNPAQDKATVVIKVQKSSLYDIYLYAIDGKMVKSIYNGILASGRQEFVINLTSYKAGSYLVIVQSQQQKQSLRLEKIE